MNGVFAVYKPPGVTSFGVVARIRALLERHLKLTDKKGGKPYRKPQLKVGHGGTLDLDAEGVLVIGIGKACQQLHTLLKGEKVYKVTAEFGKATDTQDASGQITETRPFEHVTREILEEALETFIGETEQRPPMYSAVHHQGQRLYALARSNQILDPNDIPFRKITIHHLHLLEFSSPQWILRVHCGGGTYMRTLVHDLGRKVNSVAHMTKLVREQQGPWTLADVIPEVDWNAETILDRLTHIQIKIQRHMEDIKTLSVV